MGETDIGTLSLQVKSDAERAVASLNKLTGALRSVGKGLNVASSSLQSVTRLSNVLNSIGTKDFSRTVSGLRDLRSELDGFRDAKINIKYNIDNTDMLEQRTEVALKKATAYAESHGKDIAKALGEEFDLPKESVDKIGKEYAQALSSVTTNGDVFSPLERALDEVKAHGKVSLTAIGADVDDLQKEYADFVNTIKANPIQFRGNLTEWQNSFNKENGVNFFFKKAEAGATSLEARFKDLTDTFSGIFTDGDKAAETEEDIIERIASKLKEARDAAKQAKVSIRDLKSGDMKKDAELYFSSTMMDGLNDEMKNVKSVFDKSMSGGAGKIDLDLQVNQEVLSNRLTTAVNNAIRDAQKSPVLFKIPIDVGSIQKDIKTAISGIDASSMGSVTEEIKNLAVQFQNLAGIDTSGASTFAKSIKDISNANLADFDTDKFKSITDGMRSFNELENVDTKGISALTSAISKLSAVDTSKFDASKLSGIVGLIDSIKAIGDVPSTLVRLTSALARLSNAGKKAEIGVPGIKKIATVIVGFSQKLQSGSSEISSNVVSLVTSLSRLASAGDKAIVTSQSLRSIADGVSDFVIRMANMPEVSVNISNLVSGLGQLANAGAKSGAAGRSLSSSMDSTGKTTVRASEWIFNGVQKINSAFGNRLLRAARTGANALGNAFTAIQNKLNFSGKINNLTSGFKRLFNTMVGFRIINGIFGNMKNMVEWGSDITELENVVDVSFGNMNQDVYEFARNSQEQYGVSQIAARKYAGTLKAMFNSSGVAHKDAAQMSTDLTALAGDLASFYNIDTDTAFQKIQSGMAGMVRPLRDLGISMTVANLNAYALSQGIGKTYQEMSQAEQIQLRYNYLMDVTSKQQGDFARTSNTYANQLRILKLNFQSLAATLGQGLISAITPAIRALNVLMKYLIKAAESFRTFAYTLFGKVEPASGGLAMDMSGIDDSVDDLTNGADAAADGLGDADDNAKKLAKDLSVLPFDELNQLNKDTTSSSGSGGSGSSGSSGLGGNLLGSLDTDDFGEPIKLPEAISEWAERIKDAFHKQDWPRMGFEIADGINVGLVKVYDVLSWEKTKDKIMPFINGFTTTFNSFVSSLNTTQLGKDVGAAINTAVRTVNSFTERIDFNAIGVKVALGLNGAMDEIDGFQLGEFISNKIKIAIDVADGFVANFNFAKLGKTISGSINGMANNISFTTLGNTIKNGLNGIGDMFRSFKDDIDWDKISTDFAGGVNKIFTETDWDKIQKNFNGSFSKVLEAIDTAVDDINWEGVGNALGRGIAAIPWGKLATTVGHALITAVPGIVKGISESPEGLAALLFAKFLLDMKGLGIADKVVTAITGEGLVAKLVALMTTSGTAAGTAAGTAVGTAAEAAGTATAGTAGTAIGSAFSLPLLGAFAAAAVGVGLAIWQISSHWDELKDSASTVGDFLQARWNLTTNTYKLGWTTAMSDVSDEQVKNITSTMSWSEKVNFYTAKVAGDVLKTVGTGLTNVYDCEKTKLGKMKESYEAHGGGVIGIFGALKDGTIENMKTMYDGLDKLSGGRLSGLLETIGGAFSSLGSVIWGAISDTVSDAWTWGSDLIGNIIGGIKSKFEDVRTAISDVAGEIRAFLHFTEPDKGPLSDFHTYMPDMIDLMSKGMYAGIPDIKKASYAVANAMSSNFSANSVSIPSISAGGMYRTATAGSYGDVSSSVTQAVNMGMAYAMMQNGNQQNEQPIYVTVKTQDDEVLARAVARGNSKLRTRYGK